jgi:hypothetical protein
MEGTSKKSHIWRFPAGRRADTPEFRGAGISSNNKKEKNASLASTNAGKVIQLPGIFLITYLLFTRQSNEAIARGRACKNRKSKRMKQIKKLFPLAAIALFAGACVVNMKDGESCPVAA